MLLIPSTSVIEFWILLRLDSNLSLRKFSFLSNLSSITLYLKEATRFSAVLTISENTDLSLIEAISSRLLAAGKTSGI